MITQQIRRQFLQYFKNKGHSVIPSSPVLPFDDPTLLFTNAGMNQFKDVFLGKSLRDYTRATTSQKCIRAGGKHNDLENVGHTRRHLTFFEMLGNFSFGDYFKKDAIQFAWEVSTEIFSFEPERIWPTVYKDDDEAFELWTKYVPAERITRFGEKENFWAMGDTGPCGPCSELLYDRGEKYGSAGNPLEDPDGERFLEFWNLVFMQYNRSASGILEPLPKPSIDTGGGLERIVSLVMNVDSVFETDVLKGLIEQIEEVSGVRYEHYSHEKAPAFRVIADHLRCLAFAIADGVQPSNVDRGYVLRKILRRAVRYGRMLGMQEPFLAKALPRLRDSMGTDYPELVKSYNTISEILTIEEESFFRTLRRGGNILNQVIEQSQKDAKHKISGEDAFKLKDTYGFPLEEILLIAKDAELQVDTERYEQLEQEAKERSRQTQKTTRQEVTQNLFEDLLKQHGATSFLGYSETSARGNILAIVKNGTLADRLEKGEEGGILLDQTPFYAEMGGQIGDTGLIETSNCLFEVTDCRSPFKGLILHYGKMTQGELSVGENIKVSIDEKRRKKIANNHTATHLLHWALHKILGEHVKQAGSVVDPERLRFDFSHHKPMTTAEIRAIEDLINEKIRENSCVNTYEIPFEEAQKKEDIKQFFGEKYGNVVRVVDIDYSKELCGGTHTSRTGDIGYFRIAKESSIAAGVRRIEAVTGEEAELLARESEDVVETIAGLLKSQGSKVTEKVEKLLEENRQLALEIKNARKQHIEGVIKNLIAKEERHKEIPLIRAQVALTNEELRLCADETMNKWKSGVLVLGTIVDDEKCQLLVRVSDDYVNKGVKAQEIIKGIAPIIEGTGGGRPNNAQAGGKSPSKLSEALSRVNEFI